MSNSANPNAVMFAELVNEKLEELHFLLQKVSLDIQQINTRLLQLEVPKPATLKPVVSTEHMERAKLLRCPKCEGDMRVSHRKSDGAPFFGCKNFPTCNGILSGDSVPSATDVAKAAKLAGPIKRPVVSTVDVVPF